MKAPHMAPLKAGLLAPTLRQQRITRFADTCLQHALTQGQVNSVAIVNIAKLAVELAFSLEQAEAAL